MVPIELTFCKSGVLAQRWGAPRRRKYWHGGTTCPLSLNSGVELLASHRTSVVSGDIMKVSSREADLVMAAAAAVVSSCSVAELTMICGGGGADGDAKPLSDNEASADVLPLRVRVRSADWNIASFLK